MKKDPTSYLKMQAGLTTRVKTHHGIILLLLCLALGVTLISQSLNKFNSISDVLVVAPAHAQAPVLDTAASGLTAWWKLDEGSGATAADSSGNGKNGSLVNNPAWTTGKIDGALSFNGLNNYVNLSAAPANFSQAFSLSAWVKTAVNSGNHQIFAGADGDVQFYQGSTVLIYRTRSVSTSYDGVFSAINTWQNVAVTYDGTSVALYLNGSAVAAKAVSALNDSGFTLGSFGGSAEFFSGSMDDVRVYNRALSSSEINQLYTAVLTPPADITAPVISGVASSTVTVSAATISWTTDELADSQVEYGLTAAYGQASVLSGSLVTAHTVSLSGLTTGSLYHFRVKSKDAAGNPAVSADGQFTTLTSAPVIAATYYVDASLGSDSASGSSLAPWKTIQKAVNTVGPGDTVIVRNGTYTYDGNGEKSIVTFYHGGTASNWVVFKSQNKGGAVIDGQNNPNGAKFGIVIYPGADYIKIQDFEIKNLNNTGGEGGIMIYGNNIDILGNHIHHIGNHCVDQTLYDIGITGMYASGGNTGLIAGNKIHDIGRYSPGENGCANTGNGYMNLDHGLYLDGTANYTVQNNLFFNNFHGWGIQVYSGNANICSNLNILNNTFAFPNPNRDGQIVLAYPGARGVNVYNNIFYNPRIGAVRLDSTAVYSGVKIGNNITYGGVIISGTGSGFTLAGNLNNTDPKLTDAAAFDFHLLAASPAKNAVSNGFGVSSDYDGNSRPSGSGSDIGAYEYLEAVAPPPDITPSPDTTPPTVSITSPLNNATISGSAVPIAATATDEAAVSTLRFNLDGAVISPIFTVAPYSGDWNTIGVADGSHILTAVATDSSGNRATSTITVIILNNPTPPPASGGGSGGDSGSGSGGSGGGGGGAPAGSGSSGGGSSGGASGGSGGGGGSIAPTVPQKPAETLPVNSAKPNLEKTNQAPTAASPVFSFSAVDSRLYEKLKGKIILQVQSHGEAYYISPRDKKIYYLGRPADAFQVIRSQGLGATNADLAKIPVSLTVLSGLDSDNDGLPDAFEEAIGTNKNQADSDADGHNDRTELANGFSPLVNKDRKMSYDQSLVSRLRGKILLQVQSRGEAWYINPADGQRYFLARPADAFNLMRKLGVGVTNANYQALGGK